MKLLEIDPKIFDTELDYFPLYDGLKPSSMGLKKKKTWQEESLPENKVFLFGDSFTEFRKSKEICRQENLAKYYQSTNEHYPEIIESIVKTLTIENSEFFTLENRTLICKLTDETITFNDNWQLESCSTNLDLPFVDAFDALAMQVPEDMVIHKIPSGQLNPLKKENEKRDYASAIHLCHCNGWDAQWAIGKSFDFIHEGVARINKIIPNSVRMLLSFLNQDIRFERVAAISIKSTPILNRHESFMDLWSKKFDPENPFFNLRVERQMVLGYPKSEAFLFTIRTYLYDLNQKDSTIKKEQRQEAVLKMVNDPLPTSYAYNVILENREKILEWLK